MQTAAGPEHNYKPSEIQKQRRSTIIGTAEFIDGDFEKTDTHYKIIDAIPWPPPPTPKPAEQPIGE